MKPILKKCESIKFPANFGKVILNKFTTSPSKIETLGVSTKEYGNLFFDYNDRKYLFKTFSTSFYKTKNIRICNEILCNRLAKIIGFDCVNYKLAKIDNNHYGVITENILKQGDEILKGTTLLDSQESTMLSENCFSNYKSALFDYSSIYKMDYNKVCDNLFKLGLFDLLTLQSDRHTDNILFIKRDNEIINFPLFDNEFAFGLKAIDKNWEPSCDLYIDDLLLFYNSLYTKFHFTYFCGKEPSYEEDVSSLVKIVKNDSHYKEILLHTLKKLNIRMALQQMKNEKIVIPENYEKMYCGIIDYTKGQVIAELEKQGVFTKEELEKLNVNHKKDKTDDELTK